MLLTNAFLPDPRPYKEALSLIKAGHKVKILCWDRGENLPENEIIDGIEIERIHLASKHGRGTTQVIFLLMFWIKMLLRLIKEEKGIIYCHDFDTLPVGLLCKFFWGRLVIFDSHDIFSKTLYRNVSNLLVSFIAFLEKPLIKRADFIIVASQSVASLYNLFGVTKISIVENWKEIEDFQAKKEIVEKEKLILGIKDKLVISYISNLGPERIIEPLLEVVSEDNSLFLIAAGDGPQKHLIEKFSKYFNNIVFLGYIPYEKICLYTCISDIVYFGYNKDARVAKFLNPNKLFEALAAGKAFIGGNFGEMGRIIKEERCGIALDSFDKDNIKNALEIMKDRSKLQVFQDNAKRAGLEKYNWANAEKNFLEVFSQIEHKRC